MNQITFVSLIASIQPIVSAHTVMIAVGKDGAEFPALDEAGGHQVGALVAEFLDTNGFQAFRAEDAAQRRYPFIGEKEVRKNLSRRIERTDRDLDTGEVTVKTMEDSGGASREVNAACLLLMWSMQTPTERASRDTKEDNKRGWMSSDAWTGSKHAEALASTGHLSPEAEEWCRFKACTGRGLRSYAPQVARRLVAMALTREPGMLGVAAQFGLKG
jgi:hypothetical protein